MKGTVEIARAITITYQTHRPNGKRQKSFDLDLCNRTVGMHKSLASKLFDSVPKFSRPEILAPNRIAC